MATLLKIDRNDKLIANNLLIECLDPEYIYIPIKDANKKFINNQEILKEELIYDGVYSSVSGNIIGITDMIDDGVKTPCLVIENDYSENNGAFKGSKRSIRDYKKKEVLDLLNNLGYDNRIFTGNILLISGIDYDVYEKEQEILINMYVDEILETIDVMCELFNYEKCIFAIKNNSSENVNNIMSQQGVYPNINVLLLNDLYPLGNKEVLINNTITNKDEKVVYFRVSDILNIYTILKRNRIHTEKIVTFSGNQLEEPQNIKVKIYSSIKEIIANNLKVISDDYSIIINGLLGGYAVDNLDTIITPNVRSVFINKSDTYYLNDCINCGLCMKMCPMETDPRTKFNHEKCIKCGICTYICPSKRSFENDEDES